MTGLATEPRPATAESQASRGLTAEEARRLLVEHGPNEILDLDKHTFWVTLRDVFTEPMFLLLVLAAGIYLVLGDLGEGLLLAFFAMVTVGLVILQERRSERALQALRELAQPQARVMRGGALQRVPARDLVPGDVVAVAEGERIPADGLALGATALSVDESLLTGESVPVRKVAITATSAAALPGTDTSPNVYAGTLVVSGHGLLRIVKTGRQTEVGHIGTSLASIESAPTPLQRHLRRLVKLFGVAAAITSGSLLAWYGLQGAWMQGLLSAIALGMAMLPEEFPMALTVLLALGAWRLARIQVLARRPAAIEALGAATVLCVDKTGTLTENRMALRRLVADAADVTMDAGTVVPREVHHLLMTAMLASRHGSVDPMERTLIEQAERVRPLECRSMAGWRVLREYPLAPTLPVMSVLREGTGGTGQRRLAAKGAPEAVIDLCRLPAPIARAWLDRVAALTSQGLRVLAVAEADPGPLVHDDQPDYAFSLVGLVAFEDPLRASVPAAVAQAHEAGIAVAMITGDHAQTALAIARQAGIDVSAGALLGREIAAMDDEALAHAVRRVRVFARMLPQQKLRLVQAFARNGDTVAMTGDGVNDAPALKAAHIGIAMGLRGTDVAREAAGIVLLDDDFDHIVGGVRMGRRIADNLRKVMTYIAAIHVPIAGLALLPITFGAPPLMLPAHVVLTEMVIDPMCSLSFEAIPEDPRVMKRPPRRAEEAILGWRLLGQGLAQGGCLLLAVLGIYLVALGGGRSEDVARALAIAALTAGNLMLVAVIASRGLGWQAMTSSGSRTFWAVGAAATAALGLAMALPSARRLLHFGLPDASDLLASLAAAALSVALAASVVQRARSRD